MARFQIALVWTLLWGWGLGLSANTPIPDNKAETFVLVHGAFAGGWAFKEVGNILASKGHAVYRPTLTGQGERVHLARPETDLSTHVNDVVNMILWENLNDITLVGHSYGGMVISGVMERVPERIRRVIYLDAAVPEDGESLLSALDRPPATDVSGDFVKPSWVRNGAAIPHDVPQSVRTLREPISLKNPAAKRLPVTYILTVDKGLDPKQDMFFRFYERAKSRGWKTQIMEADHNPQISQPGELALLLAPDAS